MRGKVKLKHGEDYYIKVLLGETKIVEIMTRDPVCLKEGDPFRDVPRKFREHNIRHLPVVDKQNKLVGLVSERDLFRILPPRKMEDGTFYYDPEALNAIILKHVMNPKPCYMHEDEPIGATLEKFVENKYGGIPILDKDRVLKGIITPVDILKVAWQIYRE